MFDILLTELEERFNQPNNWQWDYFERRPERRVRFGSAMPEGTIKGIVTILPGLSEFGEKYFETAKEILEQGYGVYVIDWMGQGASNRYLKNSHKRHSSRFNDDIADLDYLIQKHIIQQNTQNAPLIMLAHSMGGNLGLSYCAKHPDIFSCAAITAPMLGISDVGKTPHIIISILKSLMGKSYVPNGKGWSSKERDTPGTGKFSSDIARDSIHRTWSIHNPSLQIGSPTNRWLHAANSACLELSKPGTLSDIQTHLLIAMAGKDQIVRNDRIQNAANFIPNATLLDLSNSQHEILMERDEIRNVFMQAFFKFIQEHAGKTPEDLQQNADQGKVEFQI